MVINLLIHVDDQVNSGPAGSVVSVSRSFRCDSIPRDLHLIHRINEKGMVHGPGERFLATFVTELYPSTGFLGTCMAPKSVPQWMDVWTPS